MNGTLVNVGPFVSTSARERLGLGPRPGPGPRGRGPNQAGHEPGSSPARGPGAWWFGARGPGRGMPGPGLARGGGAGARAQALRPRPSGPGAPGREARPGAAGPQPWARGQKSLMYRGDVGALTMPLRVSHDATPLFTHILYAWIVKVGSLTASAGCIVAAAIVGCRRGKLAVQLLYSISHLRSHLSRRLAKNKTSESLICF